MKRDLLRGDETGPIPRALAAELRRAFACVLSLSRGEDLVWENCAREFLGLSAHPRTQRFEDALEAFASAQKIEAALLAQVEEEDPLALKAQARTVLAAALGAYKTERRPYSTGALFLFRTCIETASECLQKLSENPAVPQEQRLLATLAPTFRWDPKRKRLVIPRRRSDVGRTKTKRQTKRPPRRP